MAVVMGGVFLSIAYTYKLQKETERYIEISRHSVEDAKEMETELTAIKGLTYTLLVNKSLRWIDSLKTRQSKFIYHLEKARSRANTPEEGSLIQNISALFSNHEQNILSAISLIKTNQTSKANALLVHSAGDLLVTIQSKCDEYIQLNRKSQKLYQADLSRTNSVILKILISLGIGGILAGLLIGWLLSRMLLSPLNRLLTTIKGITDDKLFSRLQVSHGGELNALGRSIDELIEKMRHTNEDLSRNRELLQHSNKFANIGKLAPTIAHEIRNPLAAIKMLIYSIKESSEVSQEIKEDLLIISAEIERMEHFIKDLLKFAKPAKPVFVKTVPSGTLAEVVRLLNPKLQKNNITAEHNLPQESLMVMADPDQLKQIYMNLILNAADVMSAGGKLTINHSVYNNKFLMTQFIDTGPGIPQAILDNIFEPFIKGKDKGVGLGLYISKSIADAHRGWITAENNPNGRGAVFSLYLPLIDSQFKR